MTTYSGTAYVGINRFVDHTKAVTIGRFWVATLYDMAATSPGTFVRFTGQTASYDGLHDNPGIEGLVLEIPCSPPGTVDADLMDGSLSAWTSFDRWWWGDDTYYSQLRKGGALFQNNNAILVESDDYNLYVLSFVLLERWQIWGFHGSMLGPGNIYGLDLSP